MVKAPFNVALSCSPDDPPVNRDPEVATGGLCDNAGTGQFVLTRQSQSGFEKTVEFVAEQSGLTAVNTALPIEADPDTDKNHLLAFQFSVNPDHHSVVDALRISLSGDGGCSTNFALALNWHGASPATFRTISEDILGRQDKSPVGQNETIDVPSSRDGNDVWWIEVPFDTVSIFISRNNISPSDYHSSISLHLDVAFLPVKATTNQPGQKPSAGGIEKIHPEKAQSMIARAENPESKSDKPHASRHQFGENFQDGSDDEILIVASQNIPVQCGEDIIVSTASLFDDFLNDGISYVSANMPPWLFLDQQSGDIMGTVPVNTAGTNEIGFIIYAFDGDGNSAKSAISINCSNCRTLTGPSLNEQIIAKGEAASIATIEMFTDFGLDVSSLQFSAEGLPPGLTINSSSGLITGMVDAEAGIAESTEIEITAQDKMEEKNGVSMRFLLSVTGAESSDPELGHQQRTPAEETSRQQNPPDEDGCLADDEKNGKGFGSCEVPLIADNQHLFGASDNSHVIGAHAPERYIFLNIRQTGNSTISKYQYHVGLAGNNEAPKWLKCTTDGQVQISCAPDRRYVELEVTVLDNGSVDFVSTISVDTFVCSIDLLHSKSSSPIDQQLRQISAV